VTDYIVDEMIRLSGRCKAASLVLPETEIRAQADYCLACRACIHTPAAAFRSGKSLARR